MPVVQSGAGRAAPASDPFPHRCCVCVHTNKLLIFFVDIFLLLFVRPVAVCVLIHSFVNVFC